MSHELAGWLQGFDLLERGLLPHAGGWADQPAPWIDALEVVGAAVHAARAAAPRVTLE